MEHDLLTDHYSSGTDVGCDLDEIHGWVLGTLLAYVAPVTIGYLLISYAPKFQTNFLFAQSV